VRSSAGWSLIGAGLVARVVIMLILVPTVQADLFVPFLEHAGQGGGWDPWSAWLEAGGRSDAFPYGPVMVGYFLAFGWLGSLLPVEQATQLGVAIGVLVAELITWLLVWKFAAQQRRRAIVIFALAPIVLFAAYVHGQLDLLPALAIVAAMLAMRARHWATAGALLGLALMIKLSALLIVPVVIVFFVRNRRFDAGARRMLAPFLIGAALAFLPALSHGFRTMVLQTPQVESLFAYGLDLGSGVMLLWAPVVLVGIVVFAWRFRRGNLDILFLLCALVLAVVPVLAPASPGWFLWAVPPLLIVVSELRIRHQGMLLAFFSATAVWSMLSGTWGTSRFAALDPFSAGLSAMLDAVRAPTTIQLASTAMVAISAVTLWRIAGASLQRNDRYRLSAAPLSLNVAGDSGTGKDTLCRTVADAFAGSRTAFVFGDDYHLFERGSPVWETKTHLDPAVNSLPRLTRDSLELLEGKPVWTRHYDHDRGRFTKPRKVSDGELMMVSGLHTLSTSLRARVDLNVYLDMDESLRVLLKMQRDVRDRGHSPDSTLASIRRREADRQKYVIPQAALADVVLRLEPSRPLPEDPRHLLDTTPMIEVSVTLRDSLLTEDLVRSFTSLAGAQVSLDYLDTPGETHLRISGADWVSAADIAAVATQLIERREEVMLAPPEWVGGSRGVCQLIVVLCLLERRSRGKERT